MSSWPIVELGDCVDMVVGFPFKSREFLDQSTDATRLLRGDNVAQGSLRWNGAKHWANDDVAQYEGYALRERDVILAMDRPWIEAGLKYAYVRQSDLPCLLVQRVARLRGTARLLTDYLRFIIGSPAFTAHVLSITTGVNVPHISGRDIKRFRLALPPLDVQRRITSILGAYDDLIEVNRRRVALLEDVARDLFEEWFVRFRVPGHAAVPMVDHPSGPLPQGWEWRPFASACSLIRGRSYRSVDLADDGGMPFVNLKCMVRDGGFRASGLKRYTGQFKEQQLVRRGDVIMAVTDMTQERRIVGRVARLPLLPESAGVISMDLMKVMATNGIDQTYLYHWLRFSDFGQKAAAFANGANVLHLSPAALAELPTLAPSSDVQSRFAAAVAPIIQQQEVIAACEGRLAASRDLLLPRLISGQLSVAAAERELEVS